MSDAAEPGSLAAAGLDPNEVAAYELRTRSPPMS